MINQTTAAKTDSPLANITGKNNDPHVNPKGILGKDDFMKLLLLELQYQDPTEPMDSEKILQQTSQLASLEASDNTRKELDKLSKSLLESQQFSMVSAIGKTASLGSDAIQHTKDETSSFDLYFPNDIKNGTITIFDKDGNPIRTMDLKEGSKGVYSYTWDGTDFNGNPTDDGLYKVEASYYDPEGNAHTTRIGVYPIDSVKFDGGKALLKLGNNYVPMDQIKEIF